MNCKIPCNGHDDPVYKSEHSIDMLDKNWIKNVKGLIQEHLPEGKVEKKEVKSVNETVGGPQ